MTEGLGRSLRVLILVLLPLYLCLCARGIKNSLSVFLARGITRALMLGEALLMVVGRQVAVLRYLPYRGIGRIDRISSVRLLRRFGFGIVVTFLFDMLIAPARRDLTLRYR